MPRKDRIDAIGAATLVGFSALIGLNAVLVKLVNAGFSPVFQAGLRSAAAVGPILLFALVMRRRLSVVDGTFWPGVLCGLFFSLEFLLLFVALDLTAVSRASVLFYTMPCWVAVGAHLMIPGERLTARRLAGLGLAMAGVALALLDGAAGGASSRLGDLMCIAASIFWAAIALLVRTTRLSRAAPEMQLLYQLAVSAPVLLLAAPFFGDMIRTVTPEILGIFTFQVLVVVCAGFLTWFWVLSIYPASDMAAFSFLAPLFGVIASWLILDEEITPAILGALVLVGIGIVLINTRRNP